MSFDAHPRSQITPCKTATVCLLIWCSACLRHVRLGCHLLTGTWLQFMHRRGACNSADKVAEELLENLARRTGWPSTAGQHQPGRCRRENLNKMTSRQTGAVCLPCQAMHLSLVLVRLYGTLRTWDFFRKLSVAYFGGPYNKDPTIEGAILVI